MRKKSVGKVFALIVIIISTTSVLAFGNSNCSIRSGKALAKKLNKQGEISTKERNKIFSNASQKALEEYNEIVHEEAGEVIDNLNITIPEGKNNYERKIPLECGAEIDVVLTDEPEEALSSKITRFFCEKANAEVGSGKDFEGYKKYGPRKYTATLYVTGGPGSSFCFYVTNHYTIGENGLTTRKPTKDYKNSVYVDHVKSSVKTTDSRAEKEGYDIDVLGRVKYQYKILGIGTGETENAKLRANVKLVKLDKKNKKAKVKQHYKSWLTKTYDW